MYNILMRTNATNHTNNVHRLLVSFALFVSLVCHSYIGIAQSIQELETKLKTCTEEERPSILNQLSEKYLSSDKEKCIDYAEQALKAARKTGDIDGETGALINLGNGYLANNNSKKAIGYFKDAIKIFDLYNLPSSSAYLWNKIADAYISIYKYAEAIDANTKALDLFKKANDKNSLVNVNIDIGDIYLEQKKYENALPYYQQALKLYEDSQDERGQVIILSRIGATYSNWGNYDEAFMFFNRAAELAKKNNLVSLSKDISENLDIAKQNLSNYQKSKTEFSIKKEKETQERIQFLSTERIKTLEEIEQLSSEAQLRELKIKAQQDELVREKMEVDAQLRTNELLKKEKELSDYKMKQQQLILFGVIGVAVLVIALALLAFIAYRNKKKANEVLRQKNEIISKQKEQIQQKNILITDSIDYAKNIQDSILPSPSLLSEYFTESFVYYQPKDIVSGDFYFFSSLEMGNGCVIAAADCTGHGVPGAFMSLLSTMMLFYASKNDSSSEPAEILKNLNARLIDVMRQNADTRFAGKFGMDISMIRYSPDAEEIFYSGAQNPLLIISNGQISEIKAEKISIGSSENASFTSHKIPVKPGDMLYLSSDGYQDQIGGERKKKFLSYHLKEFLLEIHTLELSKQKEELEKRHLNYRGSIPQTDDILIIGLKI